MHDSASPFARKPLPAFWGWGKLLGPGLIWMALAQGSGELIWWPYLIAKYGLAFLFLLMPACLLQFPVVFEIGRYTVLTGEGIFRGFFRLGKPFGLFLWLLATLSFLWFGAFASAGGTAMASLTGLPHGWSPKAQTLFWGQLSIIVFTIAILFAKRVYKLIEWVMRVVAVVSLLGMLLACLHPKVREQLGAFAKGLFTIDLAAMWKLEHTDAAPTLTAIAFVGLGGFWTLFYSYWMREKGIAMASHAQSMTSLLTGVSGIRMGQPTLPTDEPVLPAKLARWYRYLSAETLVGIIGNMLTTLLACLLAFAILRPQGLWPQKYDIAVVQAQFFAESWGEAGRMAFLFIAGMFLADTWLGTVDGVARLHLDAMTSLWPKMAQRDLRPWYYGLVLALAVITSIMMFFDEPGKLILISGEIGFAGTVIYTAALVALNFFYLPRHLPPSAHPGKLALAALLLAAILYATLAAVYVRVRFFGG